MATELDFVTGWFSRPHLAEWMAGLSADERAVFNQGKDCALAILTSWLASGGELAPWSVRALDEAMSNAIGFTVEGVPLEQVSA